MEKLASKALDARRGTWPPRALTVGSRELEYGLLGPIRIYMGLIGALGFRMQ